MRKHTGIGIGIIAVVLTVLFCVSTASAGTIRIGDVRAGGGITGDGVLHEVKQFSAGHSAIADITEHAELTSPGGSGRSFSLTDSGEYSVADDFTEVEVYDVEVSITGKLKGTGKIVSDASVHAEGDEDNPDTPSHVWVTTRVNSSVQATAGTGSTAEGTAKATGVGVGYGIIYGGFGQGEILAYSAGTATSSAKATFGNAVGEAAITSQADLSTTGDAVMSSAVTGASQGTGYQVEAKGSAGGNAGSFVYLPDDALQATASGLADSSIKTRKATLGATGILSSENVRTEGVQDTQRSALDAQLSAVSADDGSDGTSKAAATGTAMTQTRSMSEMIPDLATEASGTANAGLSHKGAGTTTATSFISGELETPSSAKTIGFSLPPAAGLEGMGMSLTATSAGLYQGSYLGTNVSSSGTGSRFRGLVTTGYSGSASTNGAYQDFIGGIAADASTEAEGTASLKSDVQKTATGMAGSDISSANFIAVTDGEAGVFLGSDEVSTSFTAAVTGIDQIDTWAVISGEKAVGNQKVDGETESRGSYQDMLGTEITTRGSSDTVMSMNVSSRKAGGAGAAILAASLTAGGASTDALPLENGLLGASIAVSGSSAGNKSAYADTYLLGSARSRGTQNQAGTEESSIDAMVTGWEQTDTRAYQGTGAGFAVSGMGSLSSVQPLMNPLDPIAATDGRGLLVSYSTARGDDTSAYLISRADLVGTSSHAEELVFTGLCTPFSLQSGGAIATCDSDTEVPIKSVGEAEALGFVLEESQALFTGGQGKSRVFTGFGAQIAGTETVTRSSMVELKPYDIVSGARTESTGSTRADIRLRYGFAEAYLRPSAETGDAIAATPVSEVYTRIEPAGGILYSEIYQDEFLADPNYVSAYCEAIASSDPPVPQDLRFVPLLVG